MTRPVDSFPLDSRLVIDSPTLRLDAGYYNGEVAAALTAMEASGLRFVTVRDLTERVFMPNRFKRNYVDAEHGIPFLQGSHIVQFRPDDVKYLSKATHEKQLESLLIRTGWILITRSGTVGRVVIVTEQWDGWAASEHVFRVVPRRACPTGYLAAFLSSPPGQLQLNHQVYGAVVDELTEEHIRSIRVPMPVTAPQKRQVKRISAQALEAAKARAQAAELNDAADRAVIDLLDGVKAATMGRTPRPGSRARVEPGPRRAIGRPGSSQLG